MIELKQTWLIPSYVNNFYSGKSQDLNLKKTSEYLLGFDIYQGKTTVTSN